MTSISQTTALSEFNSRKFRFWSFIAMFLLVFVHGYNLQGRYMQPWTVPDDPFTLNSFIQYFLANGIFRFRIPMLFIISGYLFAMHDYRPYGERTKKRLRTLLLPYLIWSAVGFAFTYCLEIFPYTRDIVASSNIVRIDDHRSLLHDYHWYEMLGTWLLLPVPYQLWFIRVLLIYNLAYPAIRWCVMHPVARWIFFSLAIFMWLGTMGFVIVEGEGILFFSLGVWMQKNSFNIDVPRRWLRPVWWGLVFFLLAVVKTVLAFYGRQFMGDAVFPVLIILHKLVIFSGLVTMWFGCNGLVKWCMSRSWFVWLSAFAFMIYAIHVPLIALLIDPVFALINHLPAYRIVTFFLLPVFVIAFAVATGALIRRLSPGLYGILTGGRGL
jgi:fucose 4-O-acetylase-like acetyltransferase